MISPALGRLRNRSGQSLIQILVGLVLVGILMTITAKVFTIQAHESRALNEKMLSNDLNRSITTTLSNSTLCSALFTTASNLAVPSQMPFDITTVSPASPHVIMLNAIPNVITAGSVVSNSVPGLAVLPSSATSNGIEVDVISGTPPIATIKVNFDQTKLTRSIQNLVFPNVFLNVTMPLAATSITGCSLGGIGAYTTMAIATDYTATTDGLIISTATASAANRYTYLTASINGTPVARIGTSDLTVGGDSSIGPQTMTVPVPKNSTWRVDESSQIGSTGPPYATVQWVPLSH